MAIAKSHLFDFSDFLTCAHLKNNLKKSKTDKTK